MGAAGKVPGISRGKGQLQRGLGESLRQERLLCKGEWVAKQRAVGLDKTALANRVEPGVPVAQEAQQVLHPSRAGIDRWVDADHIAIGQRPYSQGTVTPKRKSAGEFIRRPAELLIQTLPVAVWPAHGEPERRFGRVGLGEPAALEFQNGQKQARIDRKIIRHPLNDLRAGQFAAIFQFFTVGIQVGVELLDHGPCIKTLDCRTVVHLAVRDQFEGWARLISGGRRDDQLVIRIEQIRVFEFVGIHDLLHADLVVQSDPRQGVPGSHGIFIGLGAQFRQCGWLVGRGLRTLRRQGEGSPQSWCGRCVHRRRRPHCTGSAGEGGYRGTIARERAGLRASRDLPGVVIQHRSVAGSQHQAHSGAEQKRRYFA